jgi:O-succinylbenzoic acid--CoA ligase
VLDGRDPALVVLSAGDNRESEALRVGLRVGEAIDGDVALVAATSGTTGIPKGALLTAAALKASATATHDRLGGPGSWLLALPPHHIAGIQVLLRSLLAGSVPVAMDVSAGFNVVELPRVVRELGSGRRYTRRPRPPSPNSTPCCSAVDPRRDRSSTTRPRRASPWSAPTG